MWDVDGVLANFTDAYHELASDMFDVEIPSGPPPTWDWLEETLGSEKIDRVWNHIKQDRYFWRDLAPLISDTDAERINYLQNNRVDQYFVTSRVGIAPKEQTEVWLRHHLFLEAPTVIVSSRKADAANALKANYTIDDKAGNVLVVYYNSPPERKVYIYDTPYNRFDPKVVGSRIRRVLTVSDFLDDIEAGK